MPTPTKDREELGYQWVFNPNVDAEAIEAEFCAEAAHYEADLAQWGFRTPEDSTEVLLQFVSREARILEAGCGTGLTDLHHYRAGFRNLHGCDLTQAMLDQAAKKNIHQRLVRADLTRRLPFESDEFDASTCLATLTYVEDAAATLRELCRVTRPGGVVIFSHRNDLVAKRGCEQLFERLEREAVWEKAHQTPWKPYLANHDAYVRNNVLVAYFVYRVA